MLETKTIPFTFDTKYFTTFYSRRYYTSRTAYFVSRVFLFCCLFARKAFFFFSHFQILISLRIWAGRRRTMFKYMISKLMLVDVNRAGLLIHYGLFYRFGIGARQHSVGRKNHLTLGTRMKHWT